MTLGVFDGFLGHIQQVFYALIPLIAVALISHFFLSRMTREEVRRTAVGFIMTLVGLALFCKASSSASSPSASSLARRSAKETGPGR